MAGRHGIHSFTNTAQVGEQHVANICHACLPARHWCASRPLSLPVSHRVVAIKKSLEACKSRRWWEWSWSYFLLSILVIIPLDAGLSQAFYHLSFGFIREALHWNEMSTPCLLGHQISLKFPLSLLMPSVAAPDIIMHAQSQKGQARLPARMLRYIFSTALAMNVGYRMMARRLSRSFALPGTGHSAMPSHGSQLISARSGRFDTFHVRSYGKPRHKNTRHIGEF